MQNLFMDILNTYGYFGTFFLIFIENVFPPIPSEVVLLFSGFMTNETDMNILPTILCATVGSTFGAAVLYLIGRLLKKERLIKLFSGRFGKITRLKAEHVEMADKWFTKYEYKAVFICRCIPIVRSLISIPAGISEMKPFSFFLLTFAGSCLWNTILVSAGHFANNAWDEIIAYLDIYKYIIIIILLISFISIFLFMKLKKKK